MSALMKTGLTDKRAHAAAMAATLLVHGAFAFLLYWQRVGLDDEYAPIDMDNVIVAKLVRLGKKRDPKYLPRMYNPPQPQEVTKEVVLDDKAEEKPKEEAPPPKESKDDLKSQKGEKNPKSTTSDALARLRRNYKFRDDEVEGDPNGVRDGDVSSGALAILGNLYLREIMVLLRQNYIVPELIPSTELRGLSAKVLIEIERDGKLRKVTIKNPSGNRYFDDAVLQAVKRVPRFPLAKNRLLAERMFRGGLLVTFEGKKM